MREFELDTVYSELCEFIYLGRDYFHPNERRTVEKIILSHDNIDGLIRAHNEIKYENGNVINYGAPLKKIDDMIEDEKERI